MTRHLSSSPLLSSPRFAVALLLLAAAAVFGQVVAFDLVWDDNLLLDHLRRTASSGGVAGLLTAEYLPVPEGPTGYWRPLPLLALLADDAVGGGRPWVFHLHALLLHAGAALLALLLLARLLGWGPAAMAGALLYLLHPVQSEAAAFISCRDDLLAAVFSLGAALAWVRLPRSRAAGLLSALLFLLALLSKERALALPLILLAWDILAPGAGAGGWRKRNLPWLLPFAGALLLWGALRFALAGQGLGQAGAPGAAWLWGGDLLLPLRMAAEYLRLLVLPWPVPVYTTPADLGLSVAHAAALLLALLLGAAAGRASRPLLGAGVAWSLLLFLPVAGILPLQGAPMAARHLTLAVFGVSLLFALAVGELKRRGGWAGLALAGALLALAAAGAARQAGEWSDNVSLYLRMSADTPASSTGPFNLGNAYSRQGRNQEAVIAFGEAVRRSPEDFRAWANLGLAFRDLGRLEEAEGATRRALSLAPGELPTRENLGFLLAERGEVEAAMRELEAVLAADPGRVKARAALEQLARERATRGRP